MNTSTCPGWLRRTGIVSGMVGMVAWLATTASGQVTEWRESIDYPKLLAEYGTVEDGTGISLSIVEADSNVDPSLFQYLPDSGSGGLAGKNIIDGSGLNNAGASVHATAMARWLYGDLSIAQGEADLTVYEANDYINRVLGLATGTDPLVNGSKIQNHSWIGNFGNSGAQIAAAEETLQRFDYMINRDGVSAVVGVNNGAGALPQLLGHSYNAIAVGRTDGQHSSGPTSIYGAGRVKPDIVTNVPTTSVAAAVTSSVLAVLHERAVNLGNADAGNPETMKSILMAGATKHEFPGWSRTTTQPLDDTFGAGEMNLYNSYKILEAGETDGSTVVPGGATIEGTGYDYGESITAANPLYYNLEVGAGETLRDVSILLTWNMEITDGDPDSTFDPVTSLADMSLRLYDSTGSPLGLLVDSSLSPVDNVEHIYLDSLGTGLYTIEVSTDQLTDFGLAWHSVPEPSTLMLLLAGTALATCSRRRKS